ncbi:glycosyltransferase family 4 protein [Subtercola lobariae]|uniref:Glycosyl transferase n=1 Tax=Subtercola lobariae TaxID=1588641 RepID=A0A917F1L2_9MICO|nr:glycosyltransferase family 4 protein [Subtercola lobariae]GGF41326.1 putative glycosyl transferase [Subtercola lobariae]
MADAASSRQRRWLVGLTEYAGVTDYTGGIGTHFAALLPALARRGIAVDLVLFVDTPTVPDALVDGVRVITIRNLTRRMPALAMLERALRFRRAAAAFEYDAVFLPEWAALAAALPARAPLVTNLATGIRLGDWIAGRRNRDFAPRLRFARWVQDVFETRQIRRSQGLVSISTAVTRWNRTFIDHLPPAAIVRNCVDVEQIRRLSQTSDLPVHWPTDDGMGSPIVLFVGRLERRKGVVVMMAAFAKVLERHPSARLVLAGASGDRLFEPTRPQLLDEVARRYRAQVTFLGHLAGPELFAAMQAADVVACPSLWEGFGNVALEVKAAGSALVVTTGSGYDDFCRSEGDCLMVAPGDAPALADAINRLLGSAELGERLVDVASASLDRFTPDAVAADLVGVVDALLRSPASTPRRRT